ncbi:UNVERIFIED_CONTAM: hypothetical protein Sradi_0258800 [Sesamum radiatum]|uniref:Uncharacterized protein n=1 Tax=Sesamum radiatum TaxID=300843 RepID=A0AAW2W2P6_SESRA
MFCVCLRLEFVSEVRLVGWRGRQYNTVSCPRSGVNFEKQTKIVSRKKVWGCGEERRGEERRPNAKSQKSLISLEQSRLIFGDCVSLKTIDVSSNSLIGDIPASIGKLKNLEELTLNSNQLTGKIPAELGSCTSLKSLVLFDNRLSGSIPTELGQLSGLEILRAGGNQDIEGKLPDEISNCQNLQVLGLAETKISGGLLVLF